MEGSLGPERSTRGITQGAIDRLHLERSPGDVLYDKQVPGLRVRVAKDGRGSWRLVSTVSGSNRSITLTLGSTTELPLKDARAEAIRLRAMMRQGIDPRLSASEVPTLASALEGYLRVRDDLKDATASWYRSRLALLGPVAQVPADRLTRGQLIDVHERIARGHGKPTANSVMRVARLVIGHVLRSHDLPSGNIVKVAIRPFPVKPNRPSIGPDDLPDVWASLERLDPIPRAIRVLILMTGLRSENARSVRWDDLRGDVLNVPRPKSGRTDFRLPLHPFVLETLETLPRINGHVFPAHSRLGYVSDIRSDDRFPWTPHQMRRGFRGACAHVGLGFEMTCYLLDHSVGHVSMTSYLDRTHLLEPARVAATQVGDWLLMHRDRAGETGDWGFPASVAS